MPVSSRLLALLLCAAIPAGIAGCGDDDESPSGRGETVPAPTPAPPAETATIPQTTTGRTAPDDDVGRVSLGLDKLLRSSSEFALAAQKCVEGDKGKARECADDAFADLDKAREEYEERLSKAEDGASAQCRSALGRTRKAAGQIVDTLANLRDAAATGERSNFTKAGSEIATTLQRASPDLVAAQTACMK